MTPYCPTRRSSDLLQARTQAADSVSFTRMATLQQQAAEAILDDPAVDNLSSFIGVDGANNTMLHTGHMLINLKRDRSGSQDDIRSEEHTSELQSLMRNSYAVFCLKKKQNTQ